MKVIHIGTYPTTMGTLKISSPELHGNPSKPQPALGPVNNWEQSLSTQDILPYPLHLLRIKVGDRVEAMVSNQAMGSLPSTCRVAQGISKSTWIQICRAMQESFGDVGSLLTTFLSTPRELLCDLTNAPWKSLRQTLGIQQHWSFPVLICKSGRT